LPNARSGFPAAVWAILRKECRSEWRTRYGLNAALLFAVTSLTGVSFATGRLTDRPDVLSALLWVVLLFAALASLSHAFVREVEGQTLTTLRLVASPTQIALGKLLFNLLFLAVIELVTVPLFLVLMGSPPVRWGSFLGLLALGSTALAISSTLVGAVISQTRGRGALFAGVSFPLLLPVLAAAVSGTRAQWAGNPVGAEVRLLAAYAVALLAVSLLLYDHLWED
jgi:heme exporter protein B